MSGTKHSSALSGSSAYGYPALIRVLIFAYAIQCFSFVTADPDLWGHIKFGEEIWLTGGIPKTDPYSYTAQGLPWINHEWLTEVLFYLIYAAWGSTGLLFFKLAVGLTIVQILTSLYRAKARNDIVYLLHFVILIQVLAPGFMTRPHLLTYLFLTLLVLIFQKFFDGNANALAWTPLLTLVWVNCHGGVVAGLCIYGTVTGIEVLRRFFGARNQARLLFRYFSLSCLAALVNPYGYKLWLFFLQSLGTPREIEEWAPIDLFDSSHLGYKVMILLFIATFWSPARKRPWEIALIVAAAYFGFRHQRHSVLTAILITPYLPLQLARLAEGIPWFIRSLSSVFHGLVASCLLLFSVFEFAYALNLYRTHNFKIFVEPTVYPVYAVQFMRANKINGNILTPFDWGEYLIWKLPASKVSIDGRFRTVYPETIIHKSWEFSRGGKGWRAMADDYPTEIILVRKSDPVRNALKRAGDWVQIYEDPISMLYVPKTLPPGGKAPLSKRSWINPTQRPSFEFP
ncbi:MAG: hypothetical protein ACE5GQ_04775 [Nitrospinales bacterium]